ncbi:hypothetical protein NDU88_002904 [Pleurodeles waltl]|uniref:Uncharacterized protein n=1 Tax=Pleurodeles waltl TaxID=8319 RepID=A0AAV7VDY1_PLEWA|nr:hypothetical protein NDU88_002904 [Pleurodeles waltl]
MSGPVPKGSGPRPLYWPREVRNPYLYWDPPGPSASIRPPRHFRMVAASGRYGRRTRVAHPVPSTARGSTRGRGVNREEGPQVSAHARRLDAAESPRRDRGRGSAAPLARLDCRARTPVTDGPGWRSYQAVCCRPLRSRTIKRAPCSEPWPRPVLQVCTLSLEKNS